LDGKYHGWVLCESAKRARAYSLKRTLVDGSRIGLAPVLGIYGDTGRKYSYGPVPWRIELSLMARLRHGSTRILYGLPKPPVYGFMGLRFRLEVRTFRSYPCHVRAIVGQCCQVGTFCRSVAAASAPQSTQAGAPAHLNILTDTRKTLSFAGLFLACSAFFCLG
jgi:hypothetical protein